MTRKQLSDALGEINLCYVEEALSGPARPAVKRKRGFRAVLAAAVIGLLLLPAGAVFCLGRSCKPTLARAPAMYTRKTARS